MMHERASKREREREVLKGRERETKTNRSLATKRRRKVDAEKGLCRGERTRRDVNYQESVCVVVCENVRL